MFKILAIFVFAVVFISVWAICMASGRAARWEEERERQNLD